jgi:serine/alanine adding enzyme
MIAEVGPDGWDGLLEGIGRADAYFLSGYARASCVLDGGRPAFLHISGSGGDVVFACSLRRVPGTQELSDVTTPYGYGGPVAVGAAPPVEAFWQLYDGWCAENRVVSTFLRFHPLLENQRLTGPSVELERLADTASWRLDGDDDLFAGMHRHHRRVVRRAEGLVEVEARERPDRLDAFAELYEATMRRQEASPFYFFPPAYWDELAGGLRDRLVCFDAVLEGEIVASILCLASPPWLHYHLGASLEPARALGASHLLMLTAARWGRERGYEQLQLGGGVGGREDSLWEYKHRFSPGGRREAWIGKLVHDGEAYAELAGSRDRSGFFPAYRR